MWEVSNTSCTGESFFASLTVASEQLQMHTAYSKTDVFKISMNNWHMTSILLSWSFVKTSQE